MLRRRMLPRRWSVCVLSMALVVVVELPAAATHGRSFGPPQTLADRAFSAAEVQATTGADGRVRGFMTVDFEQSRVSWFEGRGSRWRVEPTPYRGFVTATAHDETGTYLLLRTRENGLRIVKRLSSGQYTNGHELQAPPNPPAAVSLLGDLVARDGRWWVVWGLRHAGAQQDMELMEASTFGGTFVRRQLTGSAAFDASPTLALGAGPSPTAYLVWVRDGNLWSAVASRPGAWRESRQLGGRAQGPDLVVDDGVLHLVWHRAGAVWYGRGTAARMTSQRAAADSTGFEGARLAVSKGHAFIVFEGQGPPGSRTLLASRQTATSAWRTSVLWPNSYDWGQFSITAVNGRATVFVGASKSGAVLLRSQEH